MANYVFISAGLPLHRGYGQSPENGINTVYISAGLPPVNLSDSPLNSIRSIYTGDEQYVESYQHEYFLGELQINFYGTSVFDKNVFAEGFLVDTTLLNNRAIFVEGVGLSFGYNVTISEEEAAPGVAISFPWSIFRSPLFYSLVIKKK